MTIDNHCHPVAVIPIVLNQSLPMEIDKVKQRKLHEIRGQIIKEELAIMDIEESTAEQNKTTKTSNQKQDLGWSKPL